MGLISALHSRSRDQHLTWAALGFVLLAAACSPSAGDLAMEGPRELGPVDGFELPGADMDRIAVGDLAPDFYLESYRGDTLSLTDYRGSHEIILVFYRGSW